MKRLGFALGLGTLLCAAGIALAGDKIAYTVTVDLVSRHAFGNMGAARNSLDSLQFIQCYYYVSGSSTEVMACAARDAGNEYGYCFVSSADMPRYRAVLATVSDDSQINFNWNTSNQCTTLQIVNSSRLEPKQP